MKRGYGTDTDMMSRGSRAITCPPSSVTGLLPLDMRGRPVLPAVFYQQEACNYV